MDGGTAMGVFGQKPAKCGHGRTDRAKRGNAYPKVSAVESVAENGRFVRF